MINILWKILKLFYNESFSYYSMIVICMKKLTFFNQTYLGIFNIIFMEVSLII